MKFSISKSACFEVLYPAYSPDLAPSDFWLFPRLKDYLDDKQFTNDEEVKHATAKFYRSCPLGLYHEGIYHLVARYKKFLLNGGTYVEK